MTILFHGYFYASLKNWLLELQLKQPKSKSILLLRAWVIFTYLYLQHEHSHIATIATYLYTNK